VKTTPGDHSARYLTEAEAARHASRSYHCEARRCREPATVVTWHWFPSRITGQLMASERSMCTPHGEAFARCHRIALEDAPAGEL
jgi:hypothetical protein